MRRWNPQQSTFMRAKQRYIDFEGAVRSGKTTPLIWRLINLSQDFPGIKMLLCRWTQDSLDMQLKPKFYEECPPELLAHPAWNAKEEYVKFLNGSIIYIRSLKTSDDAARYAKFTGLTLAVIGCDQAEELPWDIYSALKARLSQPGFPQHLFLTPNPPSPNHWLVKEFPEENSIDGHLYLSTSLYDNRAIIGDDYIAELEREYPKGHVLRRRWIDGKRGLSIEGEPVYGAVFSRSMHVREVEYDPDYPLIESWDFGQKHPAVSWSQVLPWGHLNVLGEYMGSRQFIDEAVPTVAALRHELFPSCVNLRVCCDPAGAQGQGVRHTNIEVLNTHLREAFGTDVGATYKTNANRPPIREWCIQQISSRMTRLVKSRPALVCHPRCEIIIDGFEAGYVYDDRNLTNAAAPNIRRPKKDGYYDHLQNTIEYMILAYGESALPSTDYGNMTMRQRLRAVQNDDDDGGGIASQSRRSRAGY